MNRRSKETVIMEMTMVEAEAECQRQVDRYHRLLPWVDRAFRALLVGGVVTVVASLVVALFAIRQLIPQGSMAEQRICAGIVLAVVLGIAVPGLAGAVLMAAVDEAAYLSHVAYLRAASLRGVDPHAGV